MPTFPLVRRVAAGWRPTAGPDVTAGPTAGPGGRRELPQVRFDRLYRQTIAAAQAGDQASVQRLASLAVAAYRQIDSATVDNRYHLAMLHLHLGDLPSAQAQADTILGSAPDHLLGYVIGAAVAAWRKDDRG